LELPRLQPFSRGKADNNARGQDLLQGDQQILNRVNAFRKLAGLPPVTVDPNLSQGCVSHANYLLLHQGELSGKGLNPHEESSGSAGFTEAGRRAARSAVISMSRGFVRTGWPASAVDLWMATFFHRIPILNPALKRIGIGYTAEGGTGFRHVVMDVHQGVAWSPRQRGQPIDPVLFPADQQEGVPLLFAFGTPEVPNPIPHGGDRAHSGYPVTVTFPGRSALGNATAVLHLASPGKRADSSASEIPVWLSTPQQPALDSVRQGNTICLIPKAPLMPGTTYRVTVQATVGGRSWEKTWSFATASK
jgi:uncharacterized protein YkwD